MGRIRYACPTNINYAIFTNNSDIRAASGVDRIVDAQRCFQLAPPSSVWEMCTANGDANFTNSVGASVKRAFRRCVSCNRCSFNIIRRDGDLLTSLRRYRSKNA
ncbi:MAG: hypothetical protein R3C26_23790 [Calditrichia bacterium]